MRMTNQLKHSQTLYDYQKGMAGINKHHQQISSGLKIQQPYEDATTYNDAMRLDYEITTLDQVLEATSKSVNFSKNTDKALQSFEKQLENFKTKLIQAASDVHSETSLQALANDLEGIRNHLMNIANTSINGQFLFSGSAVDTKPINGSGKYQGNNDQMKTHGGAQVELPYNIPGRDLFLGSDNDYNKKLTTNVSLVDNRRAGLDEAPKYLNENSKIKDMIGMKYASDSASANPSINRDYDFRDSNVNFPNTYFYLQGTKTDGTSFNSKFSMTAESSIQGLLDKIGMEFGNTATSKVVEVSINNDGQINVKDLTKGNQTLDFQMVAATQISPNKAGLAGAIALDAAGTSPASQNSMAALETQANAGNIHITEFTKSKFYDNNGNATNSFDYDRVRFDKKDNQVTGNITQIARASGAYATASTTISEAAGTKVRYNDSYGNPTDRYNIDDKKIGMDITSIKGSKFKVSIDLGHEANPPAVPTAQTAKFSVTDVATGVTSGPFDVWHASEYNSPLNPTGQLKTQTKDVTYRQINDIIGMVASENLPAGTTYAQYQTAIGLSKGAVEVEMTDKGKISLTDKTTAKTKVELSMYEETANVQTFYGDSTGTTLATSQGGGSAFKFSANNAITIDEPGVNIFDDLNKMIDAVRHGYYRASSEHGDPRNTGMQGAIERIDHLMDHVNKSTTKIGSMTKLITTTNERATTMKVNVQTVKNEVIDADYAEAYLNFTQKTLSYQAMLSATSKINQLSLLNYM